MWRRPSSGRWWVLLDFSCTPHLLLSPLTVSLCHFFWWSPPPFVVSLFCCLCLVFAFIVSPFRCLPLLLFVMCLLLLSPLSFVVTPHPPPALLLLSLAPLLSLVRLDIMTFMVDWALKNNYLSIYLSLSSVFLLSPHTHHPLFFCCLYFCCFCLVSFFVVTPHPPPPLLLLSLSSLLSPSFVVIPHLPPPLLLLSLFVVCLVPFLLSHHPRHPFFFGCLHLRCYLSGVFFVVVSPFFCFYYYQHF